MTAASAPSDVVLETQALVKRFGALVATDGVSLAVRRGARHALIGPNGDATTRRSTTRHTTSTVRLYA